MSVKQIKPLMTNVFLNAENDISDVSCCILLLLCVCTETENVNFIRIYCKKVFFYNFVNKIELLINRSLDVEFLLKQRK